jgi:hypothetical protein
MEYKGLTPLQIISPAFNERTEVPWEGLILKLRVLRRQLDPLTKHPLQIKGDPFAGTKFGGIAQAVKNLLYLCMRVLIILRGEETLRNYAGVGGYNSRISVTLKVVRDGPTHINLNTPCYFLIIS